MAVKSEGAKSCLKKQSCSASRASRGRRVVFILPDNRMTIGGGDWSDHMGSYGFFDFGTWDVHEDADETNWDDRSGLLDYVLHVLCL